MTDKTHRDELDDLIAENDTGARDPSGLSRKIILRVALFVAALSALYGITIALYDRHFLIDDYQQRSVHLAFALVLGFMIGCLP